MYVEIEGMSYKVPERVMLNPTEIIDERLEEYRVVITTFPLSDELAEEYTNVVNHLLTAKLTGDRKMEYVKFTADNETLMMHNVFCIFTQRDNRVCIDLSSSLYDIHYFTTGPLNER